MAKVSYSQIRRSGGFGGAAEADIESQRPGRGVPAPKYGQAAAAGVLETAGLEMGRCWRLHLHVNA